MYDNNNYPNDYTHTDNAQTGSTQTSAAGAAQETEQVQGAELNSTAQSGASASQTAGSYQNGTYHQGAQAGYGSYGYPNHSYQGGTQGTAHSQMGAQGSPYQSHSMYRTGAAASYGGNAGTYHYGNTYPNDYVQMNQKKAKPAKEKKPGNGMSFLKKAAACVALGLFFGVFAGLGFYVVETVSGMNGSTDTQQISQSQTDNAVAAASGEVQPSAEVQAAQSAGIKETDTVTTVVTDVTDVVNKVMPSIVSINNHYTETISYFGQAMTSEGEGSGSGIIVGQNDSELLVVTNYHVIEGADSLTVKFVEDSEAEAFVKGTDADMDLAVIAIPLDSIDAGTLSQISVATLGDSDSLTVGEPAIAIGNSLGYGQSVTTGVISALNRSIELSNGSDGTFIQTDAAINPGNSGGALLNIKGEVIGINSNKIGGSTIEGMGYAIPISAANPIIAELMLKETKNKVADDERGYLGISGITVTQEVVQTYGMPEGVYIVQVYDGTAAAAAGLQKGDVITEFAGEKIASMDELQQELAFHAKGEQVEMKVMTVGNGGYETKTITLTLGNKVQR